MLDHRHRTACAYRTLLSKDSCAMYDGCAVYFHDSCAMHDSCAVYLHDSCAMYDSCDTYRVLPDVLVQSLDVIQLHVFEVRPWLLWVLAGHMCIAALTRRITALASIKVAGLQTQTGGASTRTSGSMEVTSSV